MKQASGHVQQTQPQTAPTAAKTTAKATSPNMTESQEGEDDRDHIATSRANRGRIRFHRIYTELHPISTNLGGYSPHVPQ
jgi:hypothetical protein